MADEVRTDVGGRPLTLTNLDKPLFGDGTTKAELIDHYLSVAPVLLPHLAGRCLTRVRFPDGTDEDSFYEKHAPAGTPEWVRRQPVHGKDHVIDYVVADSPATLVWLANLAAIELHTPQWRDVDAPAEHRDPIELHGEHAVLASSLVIDLDPGPGITSAQIAQAAMIAAHELSTSGLEPFVKTSGSKGLQVVAALEPVPWREVLDQVRALGVHLQTAHPDLFVTTVRTDARTNRIYLDHLQNRADRNTVNVYSVRGRHEPRVATPLTWDEVGEISEGAPAHFTIADLPGRLDRHGDLWRDLLDPATAAPLPRWA